MAQENKVTHDDEYRCMFGPAFLLALLAGALFWLALALIITEVIF